MRRRRNQGNGSSHWFTRGLGATLERSFLMISPIQEKRAGTYERAAEAPASIGHTRREVECSRRLIGAGSEEGGALSRRFCCEGRLSSSGQSGQGMEASGGRAWSGASASRAAAAGGVGEGAKGRRGEGRLSLGLGRARRGQAGMLRRRRLWAEGGWSQC